MTKHRLTILAIAAIGLLTSCGNMSKGKPMSESMLVEYNSTAAKVQQVENLLGVVPNMEANDILQLSHLADQLCYTYNAEGLV